jgi:predicted CoA-substrate-specific enzyme activase
MIGLDLGSTAAKMVLFDREIRKWNIVKSYQWRELVPSQGAICTTGYFRKALPQAKSITEITAARYGTTYFFPEVEVIVDIGGHDTKVIDMRNNSFVINDKCSAGTGAFLEFFATYFGISLSNTNKIYAKEPKIELNNTCGIFMLSEIISKLADGWSKQDVIAGVYWSCAKKIASMVPEAEEIVIIGGVAKNREIVKALEHILGKVIVPEHPQLINALGAALYGNK